jgi:hypothetical protein
MIMAKKTLFLSLLALLSLALSVSAQDMTAIVCNILLQVNDLLTAIGPTLVLVMFTYGGIKYVFSADDPGGRKQGKMICIHAVIGGIILVLADSILTIIGLTGGC